MISRQSIVWFLLLCLALLVGPQSSTAHPMPSSFAEVHVLQKTWRVHLRLPPDRLAVAFIQAGLIPDTVAGANNNNPYPPVPEKLIGPYVLDRIQARSDDGRVWAKRIASIAMTKGKSDEWVVDVDLTPPPGKPPESMWLTDEVIVREIATHVAVVSMAEDWSRGVLPQHAHILGSLRYDTRTLHISRESGNGWSAWFDMVTMGCMHILQGPDHLAFLITLIITAPLIARGGRWVPLDSTKPMFWNIFARVSAFTIGHSVSLLATSLGWLPPGGQLIEILIAVSVAVSAAHALRPIFPGREAWIAGGFGLVHGMAFATAISELNLSTGQIVAATLGFNLGIEVVQLALVALLLPVFIAWRNQKWEPWARYAIGGAALIAAVVWIVLRIAGAISHS